MHGIRKPHRMFGMMPTSIIESSAKVFHRNGKPDGSSRADVSRFGYTVEWCDGSSNWWNNTVDNKFETTVAELQKYLESHGWMIKDTLTPRQLSESDIEQNTTLVDIRRNVNRLAMNVVSYMIDCPWVSINEDVFNPNNISLTLSNISDLPLEFRKRFSRFNTDEFMYIDHGKLMAMIPHFELDDNASRGFERGPWRFASDSYRIGFNQFFNNEENVEIKCLDDVETWHTKLIDTANSIVERIKQLEDNDKARDRCLDDLLNETVLKVYPQECTKEQAELALLSIMFERIRVLPFAMVAPKGFTFDPKTMCMSDVILQCKDRFVDIIEHASWTDETKQRLRKMLDEEQKKILDERNKHADDADEACDVEADEACDGEACDCDCDCDCDDSEGDSGDVDCLSDSE